MLHRNKYRQTAMDQRGAASRGGRGGASGCGPQHRLLGSLKTFNWIDGLCSDSQTLQSRTAVPAQLDRGDAAGTGGVRGPSEPRGEEATGRARRWGRGAEPSRPTMRPTVPTDAGTDQWRHGSLHGWLRPWPNESSKDTAANG